jgi:aspartyl-tRNA(Asn)/glutamyl-tRNA(Gln) amidotransferase subunit A
VVGLKPTYGAVSRRGAMAMASSLDQIGPITKTVADAEIIFNTIRGKDALDSTNLGQPQDIKPSEPKTIGVPRAFLTKGVDPEVLKAFDEAVEKLKSLGYRVVDIEMPLLPRSLAVYYVIMPAEVSTNLARYDGVRYGLHKDGKNGIEDYFKTRAAGFGAEARRRIMLGTYVLSAGYYDAYYNRATKVRKMIREEYDQIFQTVDAIITPTAPNPAFRLGEKTSDPLQMYLEDIFTVPVNIAGIPAISIPMGESATGLPLGLQIAAPHWREDVLFTIGKKYGK